MALKNQKISLINRTLMRTHPYWSSVLPDFYKPYNLAGGKVYLNIMESSMMLARVLKLYEVEKNMAISSFLGKGQTFIDIGANKGDFTFLAAKLVGEQGKVISFEPEPINNQWIEKSISLNSYQNIQLFAQAISNVDGSAELFMGEKSGWHSLVTDNRSEKITVITRTLDSLLHEKNEPMVDFIKIDVEGGELLVLQGARETLTVNDDIKLAIDIHSDIIDPAEVYGFLTELGFHCFKMTPPFNQPVRDFRESNELLACRRVPSELP